MNKKQAFKEAIEFKPVFPVPYVIRFTFSTSYTLRQDIPPENIETMINLAGNQAYFLENTHGKGYFI